MLYYSENIVLVLSLTPPYQTDQHAQSLKSGHPGLVLHYALGYPSCEILCFFYQHVSCYAVIGHFSTPELDNGLHKSREHVSHVHNCTPSARYNT